jgi:hypothetical protein
MAKKELTPEQKAANREKTLARQLAYRQARREQLRTKQREYQKSLSEEEREQQRAYMRQWNLDNRENQKAKKSEYYLANKEALLAQQRERRETHDHVWKKRYAENRQKNIDAAKKWAAEHPAEKSAKDARHYLKHGDRIRATYAVNRQDPRRRVLWLLASAKVRARKSGMEFDAALYALCEKVPSQCPCCGTAFVYTGRHETRAPSIDRVNNDLGYTFDNVRIICYRCNTLKSDASAGEVRAILAYMCS